MSLGMWICTFLKAFDILIAPEYVYGYVQVLSPFALTLVGVSDAFRKRAIQATQQEWKGWERLSPLTFGLMPYWTEVSQEMIHAPEKRISRDTILHDDRMNI